MEVTVSPSVEDLRWDGGGTGPKCLVCCSMPELGCSEGGAWRAARNHLSKHSSQALCGSFPWSGFTIVNVCCLTRGRSGLHVLRCVSSLLFFSSPLSAINRAVAYKVWSCPDFPLAQPHFEGCLF